MQYLHAYTRDYGEDQLKTLKNRKQQWDRRAQYYSVIRASAGNRMPFYAKFPRISEYFEKLESDHPWSKHRLGKYNGLYYVPINTHKAGFFIDGVTFGQTDMRDEFFQSPIYELLSKGLRKVYLKLDIDTGAKVASLGSQDFNFTRDDPELEDLCKYKHFVTNQLRIRKHKQESCESFFKYLNICK